MNTAYMVQLHHYRDHKVTRLLITAENEDDAKRRAVDEWGDGASGSRVDFCETLCQTPDEFAKSF